MSMKNLEKHALKLERRQATLRLVAYLSNATDVAKQAPGRYAYLGTLLSKHPALYQALLNNDQTRIHSEWAKVQAAHQTDMQFLHALTIIYWEAALARINTGRDQSVSKGSDEQAEREWVIGTGMWIMLLSAGEFWDYFARERWMNEQGERVDLTEQQQKELRETMIGDILNLHASSAKQYFAVGNYAQARMHLRCLDMCRAQSQQFFGALRDYGLPCIASLNDHTLDWIATQAWKEIDEWSVALVADAEKEANDADAIRNLPDGIRLNYSGGLRVLQPFIDLEIPTARVLCAALSWYNEWCYDVYALEEMDQLGKLVQDARKVADQLLPLSVKGKGYERENQLLSRHFLLRGFVIEDPARARKEYEEALAWDPTNQNAQNLLGDANIALYLEPALEFVKNNEFEKAHAALDKAEGVFEDSTQLQQARAAVYFAQGQQLAKEGKFRQALACAQNACQRVPDEEALQEFLEAMQELAPEEDNIRILEAAEQAFTDKHLDKAIQEASRIPATSQLIGRARTILSAAHFGRGIEASNAKNFERAVSELRKSFAFLQSDDAEIISAIKRALCIALNAHAIQMVDEAPSYSRSAAARKACQLLEDAIALEPDNSTLQENLNEIRNLY